LKQLAIIGLAGALGLAASGCGTASADQESQDDMGRARVEAAKGEEGTAHAVQILQGAAGLTDSTDAVSAQAKAALGEAQFNAAADVMRRVDANDVQAARLTLDLGALARQLSVGGALIDGYRKADPKQHARRSSRKLPKHRADRTSPHGSRSINPRSRPSRPRHRASPGFKGRSRRSRRRSSSLTTSASR